MKIQHCQCVSLANTFQLEMNTDYLLQSRQFSHHFIKTLLK